jgi:hypothetical protein
MFKYPMDMLDCNLQVLLPCAAGQKRNIIDATKPAPPPALLKLFVDKVWVIYRHMYVPCCDWR